MLCSIYNSLIVLSILHISTAAEDDNVLEIKKLVKVSKLSSKQFHELNVGHLIYNFYTDRKKEKVHLKNFHNLQYTGKITIGKPPQTVNVIFDLNTADNMILSARRCGFIKKIFSSVCRAHKYYDEMKSYTDNKAANYLWKGLNYPTFDITYGDVELQGYMLFDIVQISKLTTNYVLLGLIHDWKNGFSYSKADGIIGIGQRSLSNFARTKCVYTPNGEDKALIKKHTTFASVLQNQGFSKIAFHLYKDRKGYEVGYLILEDEIKEKKGRKGRKETKRYKGQLEWIPQSQYKAFYWRLPISVIKFIAIADGHVEDVQVQLNNKAQTTSSLGTDPIPDPGTSLFAGPPWLIDQIHDHLFKVLDDMEHVGMSDKFGTVEFDCRFQDKLPIIVFVINERGYLMEPKDYIKKLKKSCTSGFMAVEELPLLIVGDPFFRKYYVVFDNKNHQIGLAESIPPKK